MNFGFSKYIRLISGPSWSSRPHLHGARARSTWEDAPLHRVRWTQKNGVVSALVQVQGWLKNAKKHRRSSLTIDYIDVFVQPWMVLSCPFLSLRILKIAVPSCLRQGLALLTWSFSKMSRLEEGSRGGRCDTWEKHGKPMKKMISSGI